jgi:hypothetical protein
MIDTMKTRFVLVPSAAATSGYAADVRPQGASAVFGVSHAWSPPV